MRVLVYHHLGLGDHIICNGLVRYIYEQYRLKFGNSCDIALVVKNHNFKSVSYMFSDLGLSYQRVDYDHEVDVQEYDKVIKLGFEWMDHWTKDLGKFHRWGECFYRQINLPYSIRWNKFKVSRDDSAEVELISKLALPDEFAFVCTTSSNGDYPVVVNTSLPQIKLQPLTDCMFHWIPIIESAQEIHTIDTSMFQLIEQICPVVKKVLYDIRRFDPARAGPPVNDSTWKIVEV